MLHWLAGQKQADGPIDPDATGYIEPPETPAPVFAVRAFKHAIFGTPQTAQPRPRRHSNVENARPAITDSKTSRPVIGRPKSSSDAPTLAKPEVHLDVEPLSSPTKGILLSPGTATARRKNVTFGEHVVDNEEKRPLRSGTGEDSPAKFPGSWVAPNEETKRRDDSPGKRGKGRTKLAEALEQARDESKKRKFEKRGGVAEYDNLPSTDFASPKSESGKYWKREYDIYRTNTQHEVKKLITKQKAAKSFAQMKDEQCTEMATQLRQEQKKMEKLEARTAELASLVQDLQSQIRASNDRERSHKDEIARLKAASRGRAPRPTIEVPEPLFDHLRPEKAVQADALDRTVKGCLPQNSFLPKSRHDIVTNRDEDPVQRPSEPYNASALSTTDKHKSATNTEAEADSPKIKDSDDIWAHVFRSSSPGALRAADKDAKSRSAQHVATIETGLNPLQSLDMNILPSNQKSQRNLHESRRKPATEIETSDAKTMKPERVQSSDSSPVASARVSQLLSDAKASQLQGRTSNAHTTTSNDAMDDQMSSSVQTDSIRAQRDIHSVTSTAGCSKTSSATTMKENVAPDPYQTELKLKPSAMWNSMNSSSTGKRNPSFTGKDGKEVSLDRIEAARARIAARSRGPTGT